LKRQSEAKPQIFNFQSSIFNSGLSGLGMGVGGVPLTLTPPLDALSRASKAHVELCRLDGL